MCARVADTRIGGSYTSERNTSTLHLKVMRPMFFELCVSLVMVIDGPGHQESMEKPLGGRLIRPTAAQKSIRDHETTRAPTETGPSWDCLLYTSPSPRD